MRHLAWIALAACGRLRFEPLEDAAQAPVDGPADAAADAGFAPWSPPTIIPGLGDVDDPSITGDGLELYMNTTTVIEVSTRTGTGQPWPAPTVVPIGNLPYSPHVSSDGLTLWGMSGGSIVASTRATRASVWHDAIAIVSLGTGHDGPSATNDGLTIVFDNTQGGSPDLDSSTRASASSPWPIPTKIAGVTGARPQLTDDLLTIYFEASCHLQYATRASPSDPFGPAQPFAIMNSTACEQDSWISADQRHFVFASSRSGTTTLWESFR